MWSGAVYCRPSLLPAPHSVHSVYPMGPFPCPCGSFPSLRHPQTPGQMSSPQRGLPGVPLPHPSNSLPSVALHPQGQLCVSLKCALCAHPVCLFTTIGGRHRGATIPSGWAVRSDLVILERALVREREGRVGGAGMSAGPANSFAHCYALLQKLWSPPPSQCQETPALEPAVSPEKNRAPSKRNPAVATPAPVWALLLL